VVEPKFWNQSNLVKKLSLEEQTNVTTYLEYQKSAIMASNIILHCNSYNHSEDKLLLRFKIAGYHNKTKFRCRFLYNAKIAGYHNKTKICCRSLYNAKIAGYHNKTKFRWRFLYNAKIAGYHSKTKFCCRSLYNAKIAGYLSFVVDLYAMLKWQPHSLSNF